jgi:hypothetical protein
MPYAPTKMEATGIQYNTIQYNTNVQMDLNSNYSKPKTVLHAP